MNQRIQELAEQAGLIAGVNDDLDFKKTLTAKEKKFAELIVWECIDTVNKRYMGDNNREDMEVRRCVEDLKQHFGVEE